MKKTNKPTYTVSECSVCAIDDYIGTAPTLCDLYYSPTDVQYNYGYQYKLAKIGGATHGYYIGIDRFYLTDGKWAKEYALYEYGVYDMQSTPQANEQMYSFLVQNAIQLGCSRILFPIEGGNDAFYNYFMHNGFVQDNGYLVLTLPKATLPAKDQVLLPQEGDVVSFEQAYFLREQHFEVDKHSICFNYAGEQIAICRATGVCTFSKAFSVAEGDTFVLNSQRALSVLDICCQLLQLGTTQGIVICTPQHKTSALTPDVLVGDWGIFVMENATTSQMHDFVTQLKEETALKTATLYQFYFNFEVGGRVSNLHYLPLRK
ncbi:MAG: hypothetical protein IKC47_03365 [Clostridia bacterium]|nr:hypothetical protein [Clostridia bacterium]